MRFTFGRLGLPYVLVVPDLLIPRELEAPDVHRGQRAAAVGGRQVALAAAQTVHAEERGDTHSHRVMSSHQDRMRRVRVLADIDTEYFI